MEDINPGVNLETNWSHERYEWCVRNIFRTDLQTELASKFGYVVVVYPLGCTAIGYYFTISILTKANRRVTLN